MTTPFYPTREQLDDLDLIFTLAEGFSGGSARARQLVLAWWNAEDFGGFDPCNLWSLDDNHRAAAMTVLRMIAEAPTGTYPDAIQGFEVRIKRLVERQFASRQAEP